MSRAEVHQRVRRLEALQLLDEGGGSGGGGSTTPVLFAALSAVPPANPLEATAFVSGFNAPNDGGGGLFFWAPTSTAAPDGGTIQTAPGFLVGRWIREFSGPINAAWFGAVGNTGDDQGPAINLANASAVSNYGGIPTYVPAGKYNVRTQIVWPAAGGKEVGLIGAGKDSTTLQTDVPVNGFVMVGFNGVGFVRIEDLQFVLLAPSEGHNVDLLQLADVIYSRLENCIFASNCGNAGGANRVRAIHVINKTIGEIPQRGQMHLTNVVGTNLGGAPTYNAGDSIGLWLDGNVVPITNLDIIGNIQFEEFSEDWRLDFVVSSTFVGAGSITAGHKACLAMQGVQGCSFTGFQPFQVNQFIIGTGQTGTGDSMTQLPVTGTTGVGVSPIVLTLGTPLDAAYKIGSTYNGSTFAVTGNTSANGTGQKFIVIDANHVSLVGTTGNGAFGGGGYFVPGALYIAQRGGCQDNVYNFAPLVNGGGVVDKWTQTSWDNINLERWYGYDFGNPTYDFQINQFYAAAYGVAGNAGDDTIAFKRALAAAGAAATANAFGATVRLFAGQFNLTGPILVPNGVNIDGAGIKCTWINQLNVNADLFVFADTIESGISNCTIESPTGAGTGAVLHVSATVTANAGFKARNVEIRGYNASGNGIWLDINGAIVQSPIFENVIVDGLGGNTARQAVRLGGAGVGPVSDPTFRKIYIANCTYGMNLAIVTHGLIESPQFALIQGGGGSALLMGAGCANTEILNGSFDTSSITTLFTVGAGASDNWIDGNFGAAINWSDAGIRTHFTGFAGAQGNLPPGWQGTPVRPQFSVTLNLTAWGTILAGASVEKNIVVANAVAGDDVVVSPTNTPESGLAWNGYVPTAGGAVTVRLTNVSVAPVVVADRVWRATVRQF